MDYIITTDLPNAEEFVKLRVDAGLSFRSIEVSRQALLKSVYFVGLRSTKNGALIGMGRLVGDGIMFIVSDIAVLPEFQGNGYGKLIMTHIKKYIDSNLDKTACVTLLADVPADDLYKQFGFRESAPASIGMIYQMK
ncbi:GNAT family N-acetyltransferase [Listeria monocytogenes]|uniref:GNAT family N-acetyltransferase n=1 Tax=Listeria monocytogenes TaxID=1639 RepID=UPI000875A3C9|nr:GNAT family N-acetyltransferase [Listeria monocytogenes]EAC3817428.1 N-acetyltransferase [Listeria monocytogenes]EAC5508000.1 N-acetyltransferase [Listeria monocytogenes]EAC5808092.1 N-acetyltransferase [Listeria monocytogenes]EAC7757954.1 N-acetyltransferase [Listeria monocytogenes]EAC9890322.1 N-acetyltransferase [Listeria monocytogenes]